MLQLGVVGNLVGAVNGGELRNGDIGELRIIDEDETPRSSKVGCCKALHRVSVEAHLLGHILQRRQRNRAAVAESHVGSSLEHGERRRKASKRSVISEDIEGIANAGDLQADVGQLLVVVDIECCNFLELINAVKRFEISVGDQYAIGLLDTSVSEGEGRQGRKSGKIEDIDLVELWTIELSQNR